VRGNGNPRKEGIALTRKHRQSPQRVKNFGANNSQEKRKSDTRALGRSGGPKQVTRDFEHKCMVSMGIGEGDKEPQEERGRNTMPTESPHGKWETGRLV